MNSTKFQKEMSVQEAGEPEIQTSSGSDLIHLVSRLLHDPTWHHVYLWAGWATQLDGSPIWYVLPNEYDLLMTVTDYRPSYVEANCGAIQMKILGVVSPELIVGMLWADNLPVEGTLSQWAHAVHNDSKKTGRADMWQKSYHEAEEYFKCHRHLVRCAGQVLGIDMEDHDLTKTKLFHYALGYLWHWSSEQCDHMKDLAWKVVRELHLTQEDHHPEFEGMVNPQKLFTDRLAVGIQKNKIQDDIGGWNVDAWIPQHLQVEWQEFKELNGHINLYNVLGMETLELPDVSIVIKKGELAEPGPRDP